MDKLIVKNFGPIKDIEIAVNDINIFIGPTGSGKSTVAKLIAIFTDKFFMSYPSLQNFNEGLFEYNINFDRFDNTEITYSSGAINFHIHHDEFNSDYKLGDAISRIYTYDRLTKYSSNLLNDGWYIRLANDLINSSGYEFTSSDNLRNFVDENMRKSYSEIKQQSKFFDIIYIPAERVLLSMVGESLFGLMKNDVSIAKCFMEFGAQFETARKSIESFNITFLNAEYEYSGDGNYLIISDGTKIKLEDASSGFQSLVPLMIVIDHFCGAKQLIDNCFIVEEPETNLYPTMQKSLIEFIIDRVNYSKDRLILTTHSPYTLTTIDNLIQAQNAYYNHNELKEEISKVVPENLWVDFDKVSCYYFEDGYCRSTLDKEMKSIGPSNIDDVSEKLGETFDRLLELKYHA